MCVRAVAKAWPRLWGGNRKGDVNMKVRLAKDRKRVEQSISTLPPAFRRKARLWLNRRIRARHGSPREGKLTDRDRIAMLQMHRAGASFRDCESIFHLKPVNGNDAKRQCDIAKKLLRRRKANWSSPRRKKTVMVPA